MGLPQEECQKQVGGLKYKHITVNKLLTNSKWYPFPGSQESRTFF